jgi:hypothetical protein
MCKTNMKTNLYYANICKHEYEQTKGNEGFYSYLYPLGDLAQGNFQGSFYVCIK